jgi:starch synthase
LKELININSLRLIIQYYLLNGGLVVKVWLLTFELDGFARVGGLGRAVSMFAKALSRRGLEVTVFIPSHGRHLSEEYRRRCSLRVVEGFVVKGFRRGVDGNLYPYFIGAEEGFVDGVRFVMFKGLDYETGRFLDSWNIYENLPEKVCLYSRALRHWADFVSELPDIIHSNDWTSGLAGVLLRIYLERRGYRVPHIHSIHLLSSPSFPWHYASEDWCGLPNTLHKVWVGYRHELRMTQEVWNSVHGNVDGFIILEADAVSSNSYGYLREVLSRFGTWLEPKTCVIYNVTDWSVSDVEEVATKYVGSRSRVNVRRYVIDFFNRSGGFKHGELRNVDKLIVASGRLTWQKGFDLLVKALDYIDNSIGLLISGISVGDKGFEELINRLVSERWGRVLITTSSIPEDILKLMIYSANVYVVPSRYEPFGLVSIEAQALGTPVVASNVGGLPETILDIRYSVEGSGTLVSIDDLWGLASTVESIVFATEARDTSRPELIYRIKVDWIRDLLLRNPYLDLRLNAIRWVDKKFRINNLSEALLNCYEKAKLYSYYSTL